MGLYGERQWTARTVGAWAVWIGRLVASQCPGVRGTFHRLCRGAIGLRRESGRTAIALPRECQRAGCVHGCPRARTGRYHRPFDGRPYQPLPGRDASPTDRPVDPGGTKWSPAARHGTDELATCARLALWRVGYVSDDPLGRATRRT